MKNALALLAVAALLASGCSSTRREQVTYQTLAATATTVDAALNAYADVYVNTGVAELTHFRISEAHVKYRAAMKTAIQAAQFDLSSPTPETVLDLATQLITLINEVL